MVPAGAGEPLIIRDPQSVSGIFVDPDTWL